MRKLGVALLAVAFALPTFVVAQEQKEPTKTEKKKKGSKKKKESKKKEEKPAR